MKQRMAVDHTVHGDQTTGDASLHSSARSTLGRTYRGVTQPVRPIRAGLRRQLRVDPGVRSLKPEFLEGRSHQLKRVTSGMDAVWPRHRQRASLRVVNLGGSGLGPRAMVPSFPPPVRRGRPPSNPRGTDRLTSDKPAHRATTGPDPGSRFDQSTAGLRLGPECALTRTATGRLRRSVRILRI